MIDMQSAKQFARIMLALLGVLIVLNAMSHCVTTSSSKNSLGTVSYTSNPLMYTAGSIKTAKDVNGNLNLSVAPLGTYSLYDESIMLCGMPIEKFEGVTEPLVLTYERIAHRTVDGVGCHYLVRADSMVKRKGLR